MYIASIGLGSVAMIAELQTAELCEAPKEGIPIY